ncbi:hypothetical protein GSI_08746 [Ganoderma sinense ZZ0214-1]|uniref:Uncharacterized protein n=1 Tax=Ganoderma sinense ZZ0214-1 TaxID=1077348 RepID=A0A2G8S4K9_9APHY|nr:hypothetical protein GSI_08746 [Ganoderma sinense ZZ0214-1]
MRLLDTLTGQFTDANLDETQYAILSHTWDEEGEQTYEELKKIQRRYVGRRRASKSLRATLSSHRPSQRLTLWLNRITALMLDIRSSDNEANIIPLCARLLDPRTPAWHLNSSTLPQELPSKLFRGCIWDDRRLSPKIREACAVARTNGYRYVWIDSCCIDKSSSSELSEAINSMYEWYARADVCYAYLADVPPGVDHQAEDSFFRKSRWFTRGWTLQELIAPRRVEFLSKDWAPVGSKHVLARLVENVTKIDYKALLHLESLDNFSVAQRLSWAANRETTRREDRAYSLLGIFDIHMPTLYGEGDRAFRRLQELIMQRLPDQSLFAWGLLYLDSRFSSNPDLAYTTKILHAKPLPYGQRHLLSGSPDSFKNCEAVSTIRRDATTTLASSSHRSKIEYASTPYGICTQFQMIPLTRDLLLRVIPDAEDVQLKFDAPEDYRWYLAILECEHAERPGDRLGRVCYIPPSDSDVEFVYTGSIVVSSERNYSSWPSHLFPLSPETIEYCRSQTELKTVYIPHPDRRDLLWSLQLQPYTSIKLVLLPETRDALRSQGYSASLSDPDPDHPTTQRLALSNDEHAIAVEFQHVLEDDGEAFTIDAAVEMSVHLRVDSGTGTMDSDRADRPTVSWTDSSVFGWRPRLDFERVMLSALGGAGTVTVDLALDFAGAGSYVLRVEIRSEASRTSSAVELPVGGDQRSEMGRNGERDVPVGEVGTEDEGSVEDVDEMAGVEVREAAVTRDRHCQRA